MTFSYQSILDAYFSCSWVFVVWVWLVLFHLETSEKFLIKVWHTYRKCTNHKCTNLRISTNWTHLCNQHPDQERNTYHHPKSPFIEIPKDQHCANFEHSFAYLLTLSMESCSMYSCLASVTQHYVCESDLLCCVTLYSWPWTMGLNCASPLTHGFFQ